MYENMHTCVCIYIYMESTPVNDIPELPGFGTVAFNVGMGHSALLHGDAYKETSEQTA